MPMTSTLSSQRVPSGDPYLLALTRKNSPVSSRCRRPRPTIDARTGETIRVPCGRPRCSLECRDRWARKMSACLRKSFRELPPTHEFRVTVLGIISDRELSLAIGRFLRRLRYRLGRLGSGFEYFAINEWAEHRHTHFLARTQADLTTSMVRASWEKSLPGVPFTPHCAHVRSPAALARYVVKDLKDSSKKELVPATFRGRLFSYSRHFFTKQVQALWLELRQEWYRQPRSVCCQRSTA